MTKIQTEITVETTVEDYDYDNEQGWCYLNLHISRRSMNKFKLAHSILGKNQPDVFEMLMDMIDIKKVQKLRIARLEEEIKDLKS